jgi:glycosyltransferase involved in cell wall biosynthesis
MFAACDLVIISTTPESQRDSGVLTDAISHRKPVIATEGSAPGARVVELGIGDVFTAGSPDSLRSTVRALDLERAARATEAAAERHSGRSLAREYLAIFRWLREDKPGPMPR